MHDLANAPFSSLDADQEHRVLAAMPMALLVFGLSRGIPPGLLCQTSGVSPLELTDRDRFVPHAWWEALWDGLRTHCPGVPVGIEFGKFMTPDYLGYAGQVFRNARDGLDALRKLVRFGCLFDSRASRYPSRVEVDGDTVELIVSPHLTGGLLECVEASTIGFITQLNALTGTRARVLEIRTHLNDQRHRAHYEEFFACPVHFGCEHDSMKLDRESLSAPLLGANVAASEHIEAYVAESLAPTLEDAFTAKLERTLQHQLREGSFSQREAARALGLSIRGLQRRLTKHGKNFGQVVEDLRRSSALRMLSETEAAVYEVAFCMGYQDVSSFNRAFKRWLGITPQAYRAQRRSAARRH